jgi:hypothetical protein
MKQKIRILVWIEEPVIRRMTMSRLKRRAFCAVCEMPWLSQRLRKRLLDRSARERITSGTPDS